MMAVDGNDHGFETTENGGVAWNWLEGCEVTSCQGQLDERDFDPSVPDEQSMFFGKTAVTEIAQKWRGDMNARRSGSEG